MTRATEPDDFISATASHSSVVKVLIRNSRAVTHPCIAAPLARHPLRLSQTHWYCQEGICATSQNSFALHLNRLRLWGSGRFLILKRAAVRIRHMHMKTGSEGTTPKKSASRSLVHQRVSRSGKDEYATTARGCQRFLHPFYRFWRNFAGRYCPWHRSVNLNAIINSITGYSAA